MEKGFQAPELNCPSCDEVMKYRKSRYECQNPSCDVITVVVRFHRFKNPRPEIIRVKRATI